MSVPGLEVLLALTMLLLVGVHAITVMTRPRQIEAAMQSAVGPLVRELEAVRRHARDQDERIGRNEAAMKALDNEANRRLHELLVHVTRIESGMQTRQDYERLHHRINEMGRELREGLQSITREIAEAQTQSEQAITRVTRIEQHLMEK
jgi:chromosome segregation ATPase